MIASIALALVAASCGGSDAAVADLADQESVTEQESPNLSPLEDELGFASDPGRRQYQLITEQREADAQIVQCMRRSGFFYAVGSAEDRFRTGAFVGDQSREFAAESGLGITSSFADALAADASQAVSDPAATNRDYVASLTAEQSADYDRALVGELAAGTEATSFEPAGCWGDAFTELVRRLALIDEFSTELAAMNSRLNADPRVKGFQQQWSTCMNGVGYRFTTEAAMVDDVYARLLDIELVESDGLTQLASRDALDELLAYEQSVAVASFDCRQSFAADQDRLRADYEQEFLDDNRFRIADLVQDEESDT